MISAFGIEHGHRGLAKAAPFGEVAGLDRTAAFVSRHRNAIGNTAAGVISAPVVADMARRGSNKHSGANVSATDYYLHPIASQKRIGAGYRARRGPPAPAAPPTPPTGASS